MANGKLDITGLDGTVNLARVQNKVKGTSFNLWKKEVPLSLTASSQKTSDGKVHVDVVLPSEFTDDQAQQLENLLRHQLSEENFNISVTVAKSAQQP